MDALVGPRAPGQRAEVGDAAKLSPVLYAVAIPLALVRPRLAGALYAAVALRWLAPDRRIERAVASAHDPKV